ncbi:hypothetical protein KA005_83670 [bacterium]|nr:hypothetical protein [bacterium]
MWDDNREVQRVHIVQRSSFGEPGGYPHYDGPRDKYTFSPMEIKHLAIAYIALVIAFSIALSTNLGGILFGDFTVEAFMFVLPISLIAVGLGFVLHEMAHKFTAQHYGCWSEFRYYERGLMFALMFAAIIGIVFAAPGATMISGRISRRQNGIISLAGPATNMAIAGILVPISFVVSYNNLLLFYIIFSGWIIAFLGLFNLLPIYPLDGSKIWRWNKGIYIGVLSASIVLFAYYWIIL